MRLPDQEPASKIVRNLLDTCRESEVGLLRAASRSQKTGLKAFLGTEALQQALFAAELELELKKLGTPVKPSAERRRQAARLERNQRDTLVAVRRRDLASSLRARRKSSVG